MHRELAGTDVCCRVEGAATTRFSEVARTPGTSVKVSDPKRTALSHTPSSSAACGESVHTAYMSWEPRCVILAVPTRVGKKRTNLGHFFVLRGSNFDFFWVR